MSKKASRAKRKEQKQKGPRTPQPSPQARNPGRIAEARRPVIPREREEDDDAAEVESARAESTSGGRLRSKKARRDRTLLMFVGLVLIAGLIAFAAQGGFANKTPGPVGSAPHVTLPAPTGPPVDDSPPTIVTAAPEPPAAPVEPPPAAAETAAPEAHPVATAPAVAPTATAAARPTPKPAVAAPTAAPAKPAKAEEAPKPAPKPKAKPKDDPYG